ncbi:MAG: FtsX-like permease family protein [Bdellovibrionota bacterium]
METLLSLAWRESRGSRTRLLVLVLSIALGVAILVSVTSFAANLRLAIEDQSKSLLGADLVLRSSQPPTQESERFVASLPGDRSRETSFSTMARFPKTSGVRLVQVRAVQASFPFYGSLTTEPQEARIKLNQGAFAVVDRSLLIQMGANVGETLRLGAQDFQIAGVLEQAPGDSPIGEVIAPRVFIAQDQASGTGLMQLGSRVSYKIYFRLNDDLANTLLKEHTGDFDRLGLVAQNVQDRKRAVSEQVENIYRFLKLSTLFALFLSGVGVFSAAGTFSRDKIQTAAILRALGMRAGKVTALFCVQVLCAATLASAIGSIVGIGLQLVLPAIFGDVLPVTVPIGVSLRAVAEGFATGVAVSVCATWSVFALLRSVSVSSVFRSGIEDVASRDRLRWIYGILVALLAFGLVSFEAGSIRQAGAYCGGILAVGVLLFAISKGTILLSKNLARALLPYTVKQGFLNISRPMNHTVAVTLTIGFTVLLASTLSIARHALVEQIRISAGPTRPDLVLFDIQPEQLPRVEAMLAKHSAPVIETVPIVTMRLAAIGSRRVSELLRDSENSIPQWTLQREYRSTYRASLEDSEKLERGELVPRVTPDASAVPISLERGIAEKLHVGLGSELTFDVQGLEVKTVVRSLRRVDWQRLQPNFFVVFPEGVLEGAPQLRLVTTHVGDVAASAALQQDSVNEFPGVSVIDLSLILKIVDQVLLRLTRVVEVVTVVLVLVAIAILFSSLRSTVLARARERALLKVLGAKPAQLAVMSASEYALLGFVGGLSGALLSVVAAYLLFTFWFEAPYTVSLGPLLVFPLVASVSVLTFGLLGGLRGYRRGTLDLLRNE